MDPNATVVIYPSDHFIYPEGVFVEAVCQAARAVDLLEDRLILLGIRPDAKEFEYGHITLDQRVADSGAHSLWTVGQFEEKPDSWIAGALGEEVLWNTMIIVAQVEMLWKLGGKILPSMMRLFEAVLPAIGTSRARQVLGRLYERMPVRNFSSDLLARAPSHVAALEVRDMDWNDWGRAERITESLRQIGKTPVFPAELTGVA